MFQILSAFLLLGIMHIHCNDYYLRIGKETVKPISFCKAYRPYAHTSEKPEALTLKTKGGIPFEAHFFDRKSSIVLILGQGFPGDKSAMAHLARFFPDYDIITFDYRWNTLLPLLTRVSTWLHPLSTFIYQEEEEIFAVAHFLENHKKYKQKICLGHCYSNFHFVQAQVNAHKAGKRLFDKLILDSCWLSLYAFAETISLDPWLPLNPQDGGAPSFIKTLLASCLIRVPLLGILRLLIPSVSIEEYLSDLTDTPLLFIHGQDDRLVSLDHFEILWNAASKTPKAAFITPHKHSDNAYSCPFYRSLCECFIRSPTVDAFVEEIARIDTKL